MNRSGFKSLVLLLTGFAVGCLFSNGLLAQESNSSLAQKVMLENTLRERISEGLSKVLEDEKFVVDVQAEIEFQPSQRTETVYRPKDGSGAGTQSGALPGTANESTDQSGSAGGGMILPGIPSDVEFEGQRAPQQVEGTQDTAARQEMNAEVVSHSVEQSSMGLPRIKRLNISVILEDGISPELLENARQVVKVASHFDRSRGDMLSMMTASFQGTGQGAMDEEAILLQNIANKVEEIERRQNEAETRRMLEQQRAREQVLLRRDSLRLQQLNEELENLRSQLRTSQFQEAERETTEARASEIQTTIQDLRENIASRDSALAAMQQGMGINPWLVVLALVILALIIGGIVWYTVHSQRQESSRQEERLREQLLEQQERLNKDKPESKEQPRAAQDTPADKKEVQSIRQSVVSMSVGKPDAASDILNSWLSEEEDLLPEDTEPPTEETV
ncbi:MAG: hypothetical protein K9N46_01645 [Candidatus Marinimicrobia bacterium]|nr:hypothetical protein [Candidatus Neomarinimicrobiota bacterium]MCF7827819.1 hypothetical protein [Candidatus Neomarinimicrobiota bacterium]MCF7879426.1 hypothetical protein [Candidatus Neomarinimicrobiota bacterium]